MRSRSRASRRYRLRPCDAVFVALVPLLVSVSTRVSGMDCPRISPETAQRLFDRVKSVPVVGGYHFEGVRTDESALAVLWTLNGEQCPPIRVEARDCAAPPGAAPLQLLVPPDLRARCPGLQEVVDELSRSVAGQDVLGARSTLGAAVPLVIVAAVLVIVTGLLLHGLFAPTADGVDPRRHRSRIRRLAWTLVQCAAVIVSAEIGYRALVWVVGDGDRGNVFVLYGVGESTMVGEPYDDQLSLPSLVSEMLGRHIGSRSIVIRNVAERGVGAYAQSVRFERELMSRDRSVPGAVLIYTGHNEPYLGEPAGDGRESPQPSRSAPYLPALGRAARRIAMRSSLLQEALVYLRSLHVVRAPAGIRPWGGSVRRIIRTAKDAGLLPILFTLPSNVSGIEPNAYRHSTPGMTAILEQGARIEQSGDLGTALRYYRERYAATATRENAAAGLLLYRIAHCEEASGQYAEARRDFWTVVDQDPRLNFGRATVAQNELIRTLAARYHLPLVDAVDVFERNSPHGTPGDDLFSDGHHPNLHGYWLLAHACAMRLAEAAGGQLSDALTRHEEIAATFGIGPTALRRAHISSGSWLIATAVYHPWPVDRLALAEQHFRAALGAGDDLSAWLGIALSQAARNGEFLNDDENIDLLSRARVYYSKTLSIPVQDRETLLQAFRRDGVEDSVVARLEELWR